MGNCLNNLLSNDNISLLRDPAPPAQRDSSDHLTAPAASTGIGPLQVARLPPNVNSELSEEEQVILAQRIGLITQLPTGLYNGGIKNRECVICMAEFVIDDPIRFLPCMHAYHTKCIDEWLMRSFTCPSCMEPVDSALLSSYQTDDA